MFVERRRQLILRRLARDGLVRVADLAREWDVNPMTVRRDLTVLEDQRLLRRVYGGALPVERAELGGPRIGLMVPDTEYYYGAVITGAERAAQQLGARLVLATHFYDNALEHERMAKLTSLNLDGLVVATSRSIAEPMANTGSKHQVTDAFVEALVDRLAFPVVVLERRFPQRISGVEPCVVRSAHDRGAVRAMNHFHALGHDRVLAVVIDTHTAIGILRGLGEATNNLGIEVEIVHLPNDEPDLSTIARRCRDEGFRAVFVHPDIHGVKLVSELRTVGLDVPHDVHIISYDDEAADSGPVPLTAIAPAKQELGYEAVRLALHRIDSGTSQAAQQVLLTPHLVERASTPPLPTRRGVPEGTTPDSVR